MANNAITGGNFMKNKFSKQYLAGINEENTLTQNCGGDSGDCSGDGACGSTCGCSSNSVDGK
ncbi:MAG: hypothetical protein Q7S21_00120 [archaeon]|nr:hypothetical protein [archaeon]